MNKLFKFLPVFTGMLLGTAYASDVLPSGAKNIAGDAMIMNRDKTQVIISNSERNVISWEDFSVGSENRVIFDNHQYLNLVHGSKASVIDGYIGFSGTGNSAFYLVNPNGITLGRNSEIHAAKVVLSTSKISEKAVNDFIDSGELNLANKGMGKIRLIGKISTGNLKVAHYMAHAIKMTGILYIIAFAIAKTTDRIEFLAVQVNIGSQDSRSVVGYQLLVDSCREPAQLCGGTNLIDTVLGGHVCIIGGMAYRADAVFEDVLIACTTLGVAIFNRALWRAVAEQVGGKVNDATFCIENRELVFAQRLVKDSPAASFML